MNAFMAYQAFPCIPNAYHVQWAFDYLLAQYQPYAQTCTVKSWPEVLDYFCNTQTSPGRSWTIYNYHSKKEVLRYQAPKIKKYWDDLCVDHTLVAYVGKSELRPKEKIMANAPRLISPDDIENVMSAYRLFGAFHEEMIRNWEVLKVRIGFVDVFRGWDRFTRQFEGHFPLVFGDAHGWDKHFCWFAIYLTHRFFVTLLRLEGDDIQRAWNLMLHSIFSYSVAPDGTVWRQTGSRKSGEWVTSLFNSIYHEFIVVSYYHMMGFTADQIRSFPYAIMGDDNVLSHCVPEYFSYWASTFGEDFDATSKCAWKREDISFLGRTGCMYKTICVPRPLYQDRIKPALYWTDAPDKSLLTTCISRVSSIRVFSRYDPEHYSLCTKIYELLFKYAKDRGCLDDWYNSNFTTRQIDALYLGEEGALDKDITPLNDAVRAIHLYATPQSSKTMPSNRSRNKSRNAARKRRGGPRAIRKLRPNSSRSRLGRIPRRPARRLRARNRVPGLAHESGHNRYGENSRLKVEEISSSKLARVFPSQSDLKKVADKAANEQVTKMLSQAAKDVPDDDGMWAYGESEVKAHGGKMSPLQIFASAMKGKDKIGNKYAKMILNLLPFANNPKAPAPVMTICNGLGTRAVTMPGLAMARPFRVSMKAQPKLDTDRFGVTHLVHQDPLPTLIVPASTEVGKELLRVDLNPQIGPWCSQMGQYEKYRFRSVTVSYMPMVATTTAGAFAGVYEYDVDDLIAEGNGQATLERIRAHANAAVTDVWTPQHWTFKPIDNSWYYTSPYCHEKRLSTQAVFRLFAAANFANELPAALMSVTYHIEFKIPEIVSWGVGSVDAFCGKAYPPTSLETTTSSTGVTTSLGDTQNFSVTDWLSRQDQYYTDDRFQTSGAPYSAPVTNYVKMWGVMTIPSTVANTTTRTCMNFPPGAWQIIAKVPQVDSFGVNGSYAGSDGGTLRTDDKFAVSTGGHTYLTSVVQSDGFHPTPNLSDIADGYWIPDGYQINTTGLWTTAHFIAVIPTSRGIPAGITDSGTLAATIKEMQSRIDELDDEVSDLVEEEDVKRDPVVEVKYKGTKMPPMTPTVN